MASVLLAYGHSADKDVRWMRFAQQLGHWGQPKIEVDNRPNTVLAQVQGSNAQFEFSGYLEGLEALFEKHGPQSRVFVFNDSLFSHHSTRRWADFLKNFVPNHGPGVYGDPRTESLMLDGRPLHYLASWVFVLEGQVGQQAFMDALKHVIATFNEAPTWPGYTEFLEHYYAPNRRWGGYTQSLTPEGKERKLRCSWAEHRLSRVLAEQGMLHPFTGLHYRTLHQFDRVLSAYKRLRDE